MNVEGDFRYVDSGAFDECIDFLDHWEECDRDWDEAFVSWIYESENRKKDRKVSHNYWDTWDLVKVCPTFKTEPYFLSREEIAV